MVLIACTSLCALTANAAKPGKVIIGANVYDEPFIPLSQQTQRSTFAKK
jgi:hypothetical protein